MTEPQMGMEVKDRNGKSLGTIDYIVRDTWSGDVRKFIIYRKPPQEDIAFTPEDVAESGETFIQLTTVQD